MIQFLITEFEATNLSVYFFNKINYAANHICALKDLVKGFKKQ